MTQLVTPIQKVQLDYKSNIFPHHEPQGSISRPFLLPKENNKTLEYLNRVNKENNNQPDIIASIFCKGLKLKEGIIKVNGITENKEYDCDFLFDTGSFWYQAKKNYLTDIPYEKKIADGPIYSQNWIDAMNDTIDTFYPDIEYTFFPVYGPNYPDAEAELDEGKMIINNYDPDTASFDGPGTLFTRQVAPYFYLNFVLEKIFDAFGYNIAYNALLEDSNLNKLCIYNRNVWQTGNRYGVGDGSFYVSFKYDLPQVLISDFINDLRKRGIVFKINDNNREVNILLLKDILSSTYYTDISTKTAKKKKQVFSNNSGMKFHFEPPEVWSGNETIEGDEIITDFELTGTVDAYTDLAALSPDVGNIYLVKEENICYRYEYDGSYSWELYTEYFGDYIEGNDPNIPIETTFGTLATKDVSGISGLENYKLLPYDGKERKKYSFTLGISGAKTNNDTYALLFYHGLIPFENDGGLKYYPFASYNGYYIDENDDRALVTGFDYSLIWKYFIEDFFREYINLMLLTNLLTTERLINFSAEDIKHMNLYEKKRVNNPNDSETADYIIEEMSVAVSGNEISATNVKMIRVP